MQKRGYSVVEERRCKPLSDRDALLPGASSISSSVLKFSLSLTVFGSLVIRSSSQCTQANTLVKSCRRSGKNGRSVGRSLLWPECSQYKALSCVRGRGWKRVMYPSNVQSRTRLFVEQCFLWPTIALINMHILERCSGNFYACHTSLRAHANSKRYPFL